MAKDSTKAIKKEAVKAVEETYVPQPIEISKRSGPKTIGKPKSGKSWNTRSSRSDIHTVFNPKTWGKKMAERKSLRALKDRIKDKKDSDVNDVSYLLKFNV